MDEKRNELVPAEKFDLGAGAEWMQCEIHGVDFECEIFETCDLLGEIDRKHFSDPTTCLSCNREFVLDPELYGKKDNVCPFCKSKKLYGSQLFLDDVAKLLRERHGVKRCGRTEAAAFYGRIVELTESVKKNAGLTPKSAIGSESIPQAGALPESAAGSQT